MNKTKTNVQNQKTLLSFWNVEKSEGNKNGQDDVEVQNTSAENDIMKIGLNDTILTNNEYSECNGFDKDSGNIWIYPTNFQIRDYQFDIVEQALFKNTLVILPTGTGKTFIAAVIMFNFYRWYPTGKVCFMAPTKPLVLQQAEACSKIMGVSIDDISQMTGQMSSQQRKIEWANKRIFFLTPQVMANDIEKSIVESENVKCLVIDEAHKALGDYAFCKVVELINKVNKNFRILALTATPGNDIHAIQNVIDKLLISHIELRSDDSMDIKKYNNNVQIDNHIVQLHENILMIKNKFLTAFQNPLKRLEINKAFSVKDVNSLNKFFVLQRRENFRKTLSLRLEKRKSALIESDFAMILSLLHALDLLINYGVKSFFVFITNIIENKHTSAQNSRLRNELQNNKEWNDVYLDIKQAFEKTEIVGKFTRKCLKHPKLIKLEEVILEHFRTHKSDTKVMVFSQYRESVFEITEALSAYDPLIKVMEFVGQSSIQGTRKRVTQKEQLSVVKKFRDGSYNTLVSTCVGEEGLDIGEVDLIICFDSSNSPIRLIQRMGRTGRKRDGHIIILLTEGKEVTSYNTSLSKKKTIHKAILNSSKTLNFNKNNPMMIPRNFKPRCHKMFLAGYDELINSDEKCEKSEPVKQELEDGEHNTMMEINNEENHMSVLFDDECYAYIPGSISDKSDDKIELAEAKNEYSDIANNISEPPSNINQCIKNISNIKIDSSLNGLISNIVDKILVDEDDFISTGHKLDKMCEYDESNELCEKYQKIYLDFVSITQIENNSIELNEINENDFVVNDTISNPNTSPTYSYKPTDDKVVETKIDNFKVFNVDLNDLFSNEDDEKDESNLNICDEIIEQFDQFLEETADESVKDSSDHKSQEPNLAIIPDRVKSPILTYKSTSTPLRNKIFNQLTQKCNNLKTNKNESIICVNKNVNECAMSLPLNDEIEIIKKTINKENLMPIFDLKSTLTDLFSNDTDISSESQSCIIISPNDSNTKRSTKNVKNKQKVVYIDQSGNHDIIEENSDIYKLVTSDNENDISCIITKKSRRKQLKSSSSSENNTMSEDIIVLEDNTQFDETNELDDDENEIDEESIIKPRVSSRIQNKKVSVKNDKQKFLNKVKTKSKSGYIIDEADVSDDGEDVSSDEDDDDQNEYNLADSFVDPNEYSFDENMLHKYRQSIKETNHNRVRERVLPPITADIFSQFPQQDTSYVYDSFVVADNEINEIDNDNDDELCTFKPKQKKRFDKTMNDSLVVEILNNNKNEENNFVQPKKKFSRVKPIFEDSIMDH